jgi:hypothetical protein
LIAFLDSDNRWLPDHLEVLVEVLERHPEAMMATTCPGFQIEGDDTPAASRVVNLWPRVFAYSREAGFISGVGMRRAAVDAVGGFDERFKAGEDSDLFVRVGIVGPLATLRRRTLVRGLAPSSLKQRARGNGDYLNAAELSAGNVLEAAERLDADTPLLREARGALHLARGMKAVERRDAETARTEYAEAIRQMPMLKTAGVLVANRIWKHLPSSQQPDGLFASYALVAEAWPDPRSDTARFIRTLALVLALRTGSMREGARLLRGWPRGGTFDFFRRRVRAFRRIAEIFVKERDRTRVA